MPSDCILTWFLYQVNPTLGSGNTTQARVIENVFKQFGDVKEVAFVTFGQKKIKCNKITLKLKVREGSSIPSFVSDFVAVLGWVDSHGQDLGHPTGIKPELSTFQSFSQSFIVD